MADSSTPPQSLRIGTRASKLARWQAGWVSEQLSAHGVSVDILKITTQGDAQQVVPIATLGTQGVFTKEIQRALLAHEIDLAVHSLKDLPTEPVEGLVLGAVPVRESPYDVLVSNSAPSLAALPVASRVGTGSLRRQSQLLHYRPDLHVEDNRGNLDTRLRKLDEGEFDAIVLAEAGLRRLAWDERITQVLSTQIMLPAAGQGALGIECRADDDATLQALSPLNDPTTQAAVLAERSLLAYLRGGCMAPIGTWGRLEGDQLCLSGTVLSVDGSQRLFQEDSAPLWDARLLGQRVAQSLLDQGAAKLIDAARRTS